MTLPRNNLRLQNQAEPSIKQLSKAANRKDQNTTAVSFFFLLLRARASRGFAARRSQPAEEKETARSLKTVCFTLTVFTRALISFFTPQVRRLLEGSAYFKIGTHCVHVSTAMLTKCVGEGMGRTKQK